MGCGASAEEAERKNSVYEIAPSEAALYSEIDNASSSHEGEIAEESPKLLKVASHIKTFKAGVLHGINSDVNQFVPEPAAPLTMKEVRRIDNWCDSVFCQNMIGIVSADHTNCGIDGGPPSRSPSFLSVLSQPRTPCRKLSFSDTMVSEISSIRSDSIRDNTGLPTDDQKEKQCDSPCEPFVCGVVQLCQQNRCTSNQREEPMVLTLDAGSQGRSTTSTAAPTPSSVGPLFSVGSKSDLSLMVLSPVKEAAAPDSCGGLFGESFLTMRNVKTWTQMSSQADPTSGTKKPEYHEKEIFLLEGASQQQLSMTHWGDIDFNDVEVYCRVSPSGCLTRVVEPLRKSGCFWNDLAKQLLGRLQRTPAKGHTDVLDAESAINCVSVALTRSASTVRQRFPHSNAPTPNGSYLKPHHSSSSRMIDNVGMGRESSAVGREELPSIVVDVNA